MSLIETRHQRSAERIMVAKASFIVAFSLMSLGMILVRRRSSSTALGEVGGPHPDAMAPRNPMYSQQRLAVIGEARHRGGKLASIGVLEAVGGCSGGIQGGGVPDRVDVVHDLCGLVVGELGPDVGQAVEPAADAHRSWEHDLDGLDHPRSPVGGDRGGKAHAPLDQVPEQSRPGGLGLLVADGQVQEVLPALRVDAPRHK